MVRRTAGGQDQGYTIVEALIFLAVTAVLFVSAMVLISGRQAAAEFSASVRDFESELRDLANDVATGYYANMTSGGQRIRCVGSTSGITLSAVSGDEQGSSQGCIYLGKAIQFAPSGSSGAGYREIPLAGLQFVGGNPTASPVKSYEESLVRAISNPDATITSRLTSNASVGCVVYSRAAGVALNESNPCDTSDANLVAIDTIAYMTAFQTSVKGGNTSVNLVVPSTAKSLNRTLNSAATNLDGYDNSANRRINPAGGVFICLMSGGTDQHGIIRLGGSSAQTSTSSEILPGGCSA